MSSCAVKDWQWLARLMERLTHRGLLWCGIIAAVIIGLVMHDIHLDIGNGVVISIHSLSSNNHANGGHIWDLFPSSWGRYLTTYFTHSEYQPREMKLSSSSSSSYADNIHLEARPIRFHHTGSSITSDKYPLPFERSLPEGKSEETDSKKKNIDKVTFTAMLTDEIHTIYKGDFQRYIPGEIFCHMFNTFRTSFFRDELFIIIIIPISSNIHRPQVRRSYGD